MENIFLQAPAVLFLLLKSLKFLFQKLLEGMALVFWFLLYFSWLLLFVLVAENIAANLLTGCPHPKHHPPVLGAEQ